MSQSLELKSEIDEKRTFKERLVEQMKDLAEVAAKLEDNKELQSQIDNRIEALSRTKAALEAQEQREQQETEMRRKLLTGEDPTAKRIQEVADLVGKNSDEKKHLASTLAAACCANSDMLDKFDYLKGKALRADQIKLVLGL